MTLIQLRYLIAIADAGLNITLAAEHVHATQPGVSNQLRQLEDELGFQLFTRRGKSLATITPFGHRVLERARGIMAEVGNINAIAADLRDEARGELRIATTHTQARFVLTSAIAGLSQRYPGVSVHLQPVRDGEALELLESGRADMAIVSTAGAPPQGGIALPAYRWNRLVLTPLGHPLASKQHTPTLRELSQLPLISYDSSSAPESSLRQAFVTAGLEPRIVMTASDADLIKNYVRAGLGVGILAEMAMQSRDADDLRSFDGEHLFATCTTWIVLPRDTLLREYALDFIGLVAPHLDRRGMANVLAGADAGTQWPDVPLWRDRHTTTASDAG